MFRHDPGLDGTQKNFFITIEYPASSLESKYPEFQTILHKLFADKNKVVFSSHAAATENLFYLAVDYKDPKLVNRPLSARADSGVPVVAAPRQKKNDFVFILTNQGTDSQQDYTRLAAKTLYQSPAVEQFTSQRLQLEPGTTITQENRAVLDKALLENQTYQSMLLQELELFKQYASKANVSRWGYNIADLLTTVTLLNQIDFPKIKTATSFGGEILEQNARTYKAQFQTRSWTYSHLLELLDLRIATYKALQKVLKEGANAVQVPKKLYDTHFQYLTAAQFPAAIQGASSLGQDCQATILLLPDVPLFPGLCLVLQEDGETYFVLIELKNSAKQIFSRKTPPSPDKPLITDAQFTVFSDSGIIPKELKDIPKWEGTVHWNGSELVVAAKTSFFGTEQLFHSSME